MKKNDICIQVQHLQKVRQTSQLKVSPADSSEEENKHALVDIYHGQQAQVLSQTCRT